ncbi:MAG: DUF4097 family beta strand repeat-containing protein [Gammaproteobacteria bacterium]
MNRFPCKPGSRIVGLLVLLPLLWAARAAATTTSAALNYATPLPARIAAVRVENLAGHLTVTQGPAFKVTATVVAAGEDAAAAQALAASVKLDTTESGGQFTVHVHYPVSRYRSYVYAPTAGSAGSSDDGGSACFLGLFCFNGGGSGAEEYQGTRVRVQRGGSGADLHVDVVVELPAKLQASFLNYVGRSDFTGLQNDLRIKTSSGDAYASGVTGNFGADTGSGDVNIRDLTGNLNADTGSGDVHAAKITGDLIADTGSGDVFVDGFKGSVHADTGSGDVHMSNGAGETLYADTGSGDVFIQGTQGDMRLDTGSGDVHIAKASGSLHADTGSGGVHAESYTSGASVWADTGSGDVTLAGDLSALRKLYIDTGSGDATLRSSTGLSLQLAASCDHCAIHVNLPGMRNVVSQRYSFSADLGAAEGSGTISTGSGDITVSQE